MKMLFALVPLPALIMVAAPAEAQSGPKCPALASDYDQIEKGMASRWAESIGDNSAPRATTRAMEDSNALAQAQIILTLMQANKCALPDHAPSIKRYLSSALACATDRLKAGPSAPSCKMEAWEAK